MIQRSLKLELRTHDYMAEFSLCRRARNPQSIEVVFAETAANLVLEPNFVSRAVGSDASDARRRAAGSCVDGQQQAELICIGGRQ
jgi:hypothetical protein